VTLRARSKIAANNQHNSVKYVVCKYWFYDNLAGEEVVMEDVKYAMLKNKVVKPKKVVEDKTGPELS
jgi:hypothetical protein